VEYEALGARFSDRGRRIEEQVSLLRRLWTEPSVTFEGRYHRVTGAGLAPLPIQRPIPVWMGAFSEPALRRVGRIADGWVANVPPRRGLEEALEHVHRGADEAGRDRASIGLEGRVDLRPGDPERAAEQISRWREAGASHLSVNTMGAGRTSVERHVADLTDLAKLLSLG